MYIHLHTDEPDNRVKAVSFHATQPLLAAGLHNGRLEVWDTDARAPFRTNATAHTGPIRAVDFHRTQPHLLCSGGDDRVVRVWSIDPAQLLPSPLMKDSVELSEKSHAIPSLLLCGTLAGHTDYVRSVHFHHSLPWVLSSGDDQTVRIWDYEKRSSLKICHGHAHYVMSARFHPTKPFFVSGSLDMTIRVWDFTNLIAACAPKVRAGIERDDSPGFDVAAALEGKVTVRKTLEGHAKGINSVCFHPSKDIFVSASDDRSVRVWAGDFSTGDIQEIERLTPHSHNVTGCAFVSNDVLLSCGEDGEVAGRNVPLRADIACDLSSFIENKRLWGLAKHDHLPYIAAATDSGLVVFSMDPLFPVVALSASGDTAVMCEDREIRLLGNFSGTSDFSEIKKTVLKKFKPNSAYALPHRVAIDFSGNSAFYAFHARARPQDGTFYALHSFGISAKSENSDEKPKDTFALVKECAGMPAFLSGETFVHIDGHRRVLHKGIRGDVLEKIEFDRLSEIVKDRRGPAAMLRSVDRVFSGPKEHCIVECTTTEGVLWLLYAFRKKEVVACRIIEKAPAFVVWQNALNEKRYGLLVYDSSITVLDENFDFVCTIDSYGAKIDSAVFDSGDFVKSAGISEKNALIFFTAGQQLLYAVVPSGQVGVVRGCGTRLSLMRGDIENGSFTVGVPTEDSAAELAQADGCIAIDGRIARVHVDTEVLKLEILLKMGNFLEMNQTLLESLAENISESQCLPLPFIQEIMASALPKKISVKLLRCIDADCQKQFRVQKWLFGLALAYNDIEFARTRLEASKILTGKQDTQDLFEMYEKLIECAIKAGNSKIARQCAQEIPSSVLKPWHAVLCSFPGAPPSESSDDPFGDIVQNVLAGNMEKASDILQKEGFAELATKMQSVEPLQAMFSEINLGNSPKPEFTLNDYFTERKPVVPETVAEEDTPPVQQYIPEPETSSETEIDAPAPKQRDDPFDFIFESSDDDA